MSVNRDGRPNPEALLAKLEKTAQARLRGYIGASPWVGKTYQMLEDGHLLRKQGVDIVIGFIEAYCRGDTEAKIGDLEIILRKKIEYCNVVLAVIELESIIARKP